MATAGSYTRAQDMERQVINSCSKCIISKKHEIRPKVVDVVDVHMSQVRDFLSLDAYMNTIFCPKLDR